MTETNPWHKPDGTVEKIRVWSAQGEFGPRLPDPKPGKFFDDVTMQLFGLGAAPAGIPSMTGFVDNYLHPKERGDRGSEDITPEPRTIMHTFTPAQTPALSSLARAFGVSDQWFGSAPCETWPNRYFTHAGTAGGWVNNERSRFPYRWPRFLPTIFRRLDSRGYKWRMYFHDLPAGGDPGRPLAKDSHPLLPVSGRVRAPRHERPAGALQLHRAALLSLAQLPA